jgi:hypothetical protein
MNISPNNEKIEKYLDELADEYRILLYKALISRSKPLDDLSVSELLRLDNEIKKPLFEDYQRQQKRRRMLFTLGLAYIFIALFSFIFAKIIWGDFQYNKEDMITLMCLILSIIGLLISIYSYASVSLNFFPQNNTNRSEEDYHICEYEVIATWRELEGIVYDIGINENVKMPRSIIEYLSQNHFIDEKEHSILKEFLKLRNDVVHSNEYSYSSGEIKEMLDQVNRIIDKVKKIV